MRPSLSFLLRSLLLLPLSAVLAAACGGNVVVEPPPGCDPGLVACGAACVDLDTNDEHCGGCDQPCGDGDCLAGVCLYDQPTCQAPLTACSGQCVDLYKDDNNCGECGNVCPPDWTCETNYCEFLGVCVCGDVCSAILVDPVLPQTFFDTTFAVGNTVEPPCGSPGGNDLSYSLAAPSDGLYTFDTVGSTVDTVLYVRRASTCEVVACSEDELYDGATFVSVKLAKNEIVLVTVDTPNGDGDFVLHVSSDQTCGSGCGELISGGGTDIPVCADSLVLYKQLTDCVCLGACAAPCQSLCQGSDATAACQDCVLDAGGGCGNEYNECTNDF
jgi:Stigma-specific protein, Stig1